MALSGRCVRLLEIGQLISGQRMARCQFRLKRPLAFGQPDYREVDIFLAQLDDPFFHHPVYKRPILILSATWTPSRCATEPDGLKCGTDSTDPWMKLGAPLNLVKDNW